MRENGLMVTGAALPDAPAPNDVVEQQLYRAWLAVPPQRTWGETAAECVRFLEGDQWDESEVAKRDQAKRPHLTINKIKPLFQLVTGYMAQRRIQPIVRPGNDALSSDTVATTFTKLLANINSRNKLEYLQTEAFVDGLASGRGYLDVRLDFENNALGEVKVRSPNPFHVYPDPEAEDFDPKDWNFYIEDRWLSVNDIMVYYGQLAVEEVSKLATDFQARGSLLDRYFYGSGIGPAEYFGLMGLHNQQRAGWYDRLFPAASFPGLDGTWFVDPQRKLIRILDCQHKRLVPVQQFVDMQTGQSSDIPDDWPPEKIQAVMLWSEQRGMEMGWGQTLTVRKTSKRKWRWTVTAGDVLLHDGWSPYDMPTLCTFFPYFRRGRTLGMINDLIDPQTEINRRRSARAEIVAKTANGGWLYEDQSLSAEQEENLRRFGSSPGVLIKYKNGTKPPEQIIATPPNHSQGLLEEEATADLKEISGVNDSALGQVDKVQSGRAVLARQKQTVVGIESYFTNFERLIGQVGDREVHCVQRGYSEQRIFRERGDDGMDTIYKLNDRMGDGTIANDVTTGTYEATIDTAPNTATFEDLEFETMMTMQDKGLPLMQVAPDIVVDAAPIRRKREIVDRIKASMGMAGQPGGAPPGMPVAPGGAPPLPPGGAPPSPMDAGPAANVVPMTPRAAGG